MNVVRGFLAHERSVLMLMLLASVAAHAAAFYTVRVVDAKDVSGGWDRPRAYLMNPAFEPAAGRRYLYTLADLADPSLISLPSTRGFSKTLWRKGQPVTMRPVDWNIGPAYLKNRPPPAAPVLIVETPLNEALQSMVQKGPIATGAATDPIPSVSGASRSYLRILGDLEKRPVKAAPEFPVMSVAGGLRPTTIRIAVSPDGVVNYAMLDRGSGHADADQQALQLVRTLRFAASGGRGEDALDWGMARIFWAVIPPRPPEKPLQDAP